MFRFYIKSPLLMLSNTWWWQLLCLYKFHTTLWCFLCLQMCKGLYHWGQQKTRKIMPLPQRGVKGRPWQKGFTLKKDSPILSSHDTAAKIAFSLNDNLEAACINACCTFLHFLQPELYRFATIKWVLLNRKSRHKLIIKKTIRMSRIFSFLE